MSTAKIISLSVRPLFGAHLCFEVGGILGESNTQLGASVGAFDFATFYATLGSIPTIPGDPGRLLYDFLEIQAFVNPFTLASLRAEPKKAALHKAINARANAYYAKYANAQAIIVHMTDLYSPLSEFSKPNRLENLANISQEQFETIRAAYISDGRLGVIRKTESVLHSNLSSTGNSTTKNANFETTGATFPPPLPGSKETIGSPDNPVREDFQEGTSSGSATEDQTISNTDYGYRIPFHENSAQYERAQISLIDEQFAQFMFGQNLPFLGAVFQNELNSIDSDVFRLQIAYLNTILMSPIDGMITGMYKSPGDAVRAGEPVIRIEDNSNILLVATLIYRGPIFINFNVQVQTRLFDSSGPPTTVTGTVVAARGLSEDDHWEVIVQCKNLDDRGKYIFPFGYHFDYDDTKLTLSDPPPVVGS